MPSIYHSDCCASKTICNLAKLSFRTKFNGPIKALDPEHLRKEDPIDLDIIDESLYYFKSIVFFNQFEITNDSDRNLIYLTLFIIECLKLLSKAVNRKQACQELINFSTNTFAIPGDANFPLNHLFQKPKSNDEMDELRSYLGQMRQECSSRLIDIAWPAEEDSPSKWWICFSKRKFINLTLNEINMY
ncbi:Actin-related protein 2/3 complex subunit 3 [Sarcoptes scabiei]|uniref:Actin-related protein 2/3 complex subunit 3 n=1 Tax=Sarcoptes scabiei TaxID=52283 RepID=A0A131ZYV9_SARSC|nr:Actin-related protein 2/3 complex subunit 3 [Sarcoptes scabiei]KPM04052.1 actin-related 2/3 complex subunit 3-like protein [Sarcoptes scabiei]UXI22591.1 DC-STAMP domain-containing protein 2-like [Sarcoptes scabiei]